MVCNAPAPCADCVRELPQARVWESIFVPHVFALSGRAHVGLLTNFVLSRVQPSLRDPVALTGFATRFDWGCFWLSWCSALVLSAHVVLIGLLCVSGVYVH